MQQLRLSIRDVVPVKFFRISIIKPALSCNAKQLDKSRSDELRASLYFHVEWRIEDRCRLHRDVQAMRILKHHPVIERQYTRIVNRDIVYLVASLRPLLSTMLLMIVKPVTYRRWLRFFAFHDRLRREPNASWSVVKKHSLTFYTTSRRVAPSSVYMLLKFLNKFSFKIYTLEIILKAFFCFTETNYLWDFH